MATVAVAMVDIPTGIVIIQQATVLTRARVVKAIQTPIPKGMTTLRMKMLKLNHCRLLLQARVCYHLLQAFAVEHDDHLQPLSHGSYQSMLIQFSRYSNGGSNGYSNGYSNGGGYNSSGAFGGGGDKMSNLGASLKMPNWGK